MKTFRRPDSGRKLPGLAIVIMLLLGMLVPGPAMADAGVVAGTTAVIANADGQNVKLREAPGYEAPEIARFAEGTTVEVIEGPVDGDADLWFEVKVSDHQGFMAADFLKRAPAVPATPPAPTTPTGPVSGRATANEAVHVRGGPSTADSIVVTLQAGAGVTLTGGEKNGWVSVSAAGGDGWVAREFLTLAGSPTPVTPTPTTPPVTPTATATPDGEVRYVLETLHLRSGPGESFESLGVLPVGAQLFLTGEHDGLFAKVTSAFGDGWVYNQVIGPVNPNPTATVTPSATVTPTVTSEPQTPTPTETSDQTGTRYTLEPMHLRSGPSDDANSVVFMDSGVPMQLLGEEQSGFVRVSTVFGDGWVRAALIGETAPGSTPTPPPTATTSPDVTPIVTATPDVTPTETPGETVSRWTTESVNLRAGSSAGSASLGVIAAGTEVQYTGQAENGFSQVVTTLGTGWIATEYLSETAPVVTPTPTDEPSGSLLSWPVQGGQWRVLQGYNGSSHQNRSSTWQYLYSLDLVRADGSTAGQPVYAPADGVVRWIDEVSGGGAIYLGNGQAFAWFHTIVDPSIQEGGTVRRGQLLGVLAPAGVAGAGSTPHLHISMWETDDEGNWSRRAVPFSGQYALNGAEFPSNGSGYQWTGFVFNP